VKNDRYQHQQRAEGGGINGEHRVPTQRAGENEKNRINSEQYRDYRQDGLRLRSHLMNAVPLGGFLLPEGMDEGGGEELYAEDDLKRPEESIHSSPVEVDAFFES
jgi:hypothetical protein